VNDFLIQRLAVVLVILTDVNAHENALALEPVHSRLRE
jgi:hypothetical protein